MKWLVLAAKQKEPTALTSGMKKGSFYKISGIATKKGWGAFDKEGWIDEN
ncbi:MAG: hypothetical protein JHC35_00435, partial [Sulfuricurvum sp.]|nr:hypothetical protein [Sulfuricurvum sp.]